jgi:hypothetical protein
MGVMYADLSKKGLVVSQKDKIISIISVKTDNFKLLFCFVHISFLSLWLV